MDLDDEELEATRKMKFNSLYGKFVTKDKEPVKISKLEDVEILTESILSNCRNLEELQGLYIKLQNGLDKITFKRQKELEGGI